MEGRVIEQSSAPLPKKLAYNAKQRKPKQHLHWWLQNIERLEYKFGRISIISRNKSVQLTKFHSICHTQYVICLFCQSKLFFFFTKSTHFKNRFLLQKYTCIFLSHVSFPKHTILVYSYKSQLYCLFVAFSCVLSL